jgi:4'-phosphopantetheinyl transferase
VSAYWFEQTQASVPEHYEWLAKSELVILQRLHVPKRRIDWLLGRWTAKCAVASVLQLLQDDATLQRITVLADPSAAPRAYVDHQPAGVSISLSHRDGIAVCALAEATMPVGCDLELIETRSDAFVGDYFTAYEQAIVAQQPEIKRDRIVTVFWSAKESALKTMRVGLRADTRSVEVHLCAHNEKPVEQRDRKETDSLLSHCLADRWHPFQTHCQAGQVLYGWWSTAGSMVKTIATTSPVGPPRLFKVESFDYSPCIP